MRSEVNWAIALSVLGLLGCARTQIELPAVHVYPHSAQSLDFWEGLESHPVLCNEDALHGLLLLADGTDPWLTYAERVQEAQARGWLAEDRVPDGKESVRFGTVALAVCDILDLRGGATTRLLGPSERSCSRDLVAQGLVPQRSEMQALSGLEFIDLIGLVEDRRAAAATEDE